MYPFDTLPGKSTANLNDTNNKTWDGYDTFANVPINYEKTLLVSLNLVKKNY